MKELLFPDLKKAFDTVCHEILLQKLNHYGIRRKVNDLIRSYLLGRRQYVFISRCCSLAKVVEYVVPPSQILSIFFSLYMSMTFFIIWNADDSSLNLSENVGDSSKIT